MYIFYEFLLILTFSGAWPDRSYCGYPHHICNRCGASLWYKERNKGLSTEKKVKRVIYTLCCRVDIYPFLSILLGHPRSPKAIEFDVGTFIEGRLFSTFLLRDFVVPEYPEVPLH
jgi:hypothetical protein